MAARRSLSLQQVYDRLFAAYGPRHWWPGDSPFEIMIGAILTQNTAWTNVEKAMANLKARNKLAPQAIIAARKDHLARWIRPSGYFNSKAQRLKAFCQWYVEQGEWEGLAQLETDALRNALLAVHGIGPETADDILLYAFERPVFVIDAYTRRIFSRLDLVDGGKGYEELRIFFEDQLVTNHQLFNEYHALIVEHGKEVCRTRPRCDTCVLRAHCGRPGSANPTD